MCIKYKALGQTYLVSCAFQSSFASGFHKRSSPVPFISWGVELLYMHCILRWDVYWQYEGMKDLKLLDSCWCGTVQDFLSTIGPFWVGCQRGYLIHSESCLVMSWFGTWWIHTCVDAVGFKYLKLDIKLILKLNLYPYLLF